MSFYLGTGGSGKIMHITKGSHSDNVMQGSILSDTVFHSDLDYITYSLHIASSIEDLLLSGSKVGTVVKLPTSALSLINNGYWYFIIYKVSGVWYQYLNYLSNAPTNIRWTTTNDYASSLAYYPDASHLYANLLISAGVTVTDCYFVVIDNLTTTGYEEINKPANDVFLGNGDIVVKGVDLFDLTYINANPINLEDISFNTNSGQMQLINSASAMPGTMSLKSNSLKTEILLGSKAIFTTDVVRDKVFYDSKITSHIPYGVVVTSVSGTFYTTIFSAGTFEVGDMFFIKYFVDGNTGNDFDAQSNALLRFVEGLIYTYSYNFLSGAYTIFMDYYGLASGALQIRFRITITASGTLYSKIYDFTCFKLK